MVVKLTTGRSLHGALAYNERKLGKGEAVSLGALNTPVDAARQGLAEKSATLKKLAARNTRTKRNAYHIAVSFAPGEKVGGARMREIAVDYLEGIGFAGQPAYLYRHLDTAHPHFHIVTTNIRWDGKRIEDSFIGATKSEAARKAIEVKYGLVRAEGRQLGPELNEGKTLKSKARYWVGQALKGTRPSSVGELNGVLRPKGIRLREHSGERADGAPFRGYVVARIDPATGWEVSAGTKASRLFAKGFAEKLGRVFEGNVAGKAKRLGRVKEAVRAAFGDGELNADQVQAELKRRGVLVVQSRNAEGRLFGVHYLDAEGGYVYKASEASRAHGAKAWREREVLAPKALIRRQQRGRGMGL